VSKNVTFGGKNKIGKNGLIRNSQIGRGTYIGENCNVCNTDIGNYCSIGYGFQVVIGRHPVEKFVSTHPCFFSTGKQAGFTYTAEQRFEEYVYVNEKSKKCVSIGSDVWIGANVTILNGVTVGDGAVIGTGALVLKDVAPYEIVAGVPAKRIGVRFTEEERNLLLQFKWWKKEDTWLREHVDLFTDIEKMKDWINCYGT
jgi:acetyltransferase-like isoleucine patch superfamily enzyme